MKHSSRVLSNQVRIIGGQWRGRKISFPNSEGLRPTSDRIRETLFNWLMGHIVGARCCDFFAGSGALGFEALSRGASWVSFIENNNAVISELRATAKLFNTQACEFFQEDALNYLTRSTDVFDIIFLDPPFHKAYLADCLKLLSTAQCLHEDTLIYVEAEYDLSIDLGPLSLNLLKQKKAGKVFYHLLKLQG